MKIPYGQSNYRKVIRNGYYYVDKTAFVRTLEEQGDYHILLRPRRFGKSLFLSMLWHYYDVNFTDEFETLFGHLDIGNNPTPTHNSYQVLFIEFSGIPTNDRTGIQRIFTTKIHMALQNFLRRYRYPEAAVGGLDAYASASEKMEYFLDATAQTKVYLLIDEYDHFANALLANDLEHFRSIVGKGGFVRAFYEVLKAATQRGVLDRLFITGVTPMMLDSLTSGFNIVENLSHHARFNQAIGFTRAETQALVEPLADNCTLDSKSLLDDVTRWYNGYLFSGQTPTRDTLFNADMILYFVKHFDQAQCAYPRRMLDENIASDYGKILAMFSIGSRDDNYEVLEQLIGHDEVSALHRRKFDFDKGFDRDDFISLLLYMGFVTFKDVTLGRERFQIPNYVIRTLYYEYFKVELERRNQIRMPGVQLEDSIIALALHNDPSALAKDIEGVLANFSNRDYIQLNEKHIKTLLLTLLFQSPVYFIKSEPELNRHYPDILLLERSPFEVKHQHLIELKYCKQSERQKSPELWQRKLEEGIGQVRNYLQLPDVKALSRLSAWVLLTDGAEVMIQAVAADQQ
jgi:hypothetical protein